MKKFLALLLAICLLTSFAPVMAEDTTGTTEETTATEEGDTTEEGGTDTPASGNTITDVNGTASMEINLTVDRSKDKFTVVIPASVTIDPVSKKGEFEVKLKDVEFNASTMISVYASTTSAMTDQSRNNYLTNAEGDKLLYKMYADSVVVVSTDTEIMSLTPESGKTETSATLSVVVISASYHEGTYSDTLTFSVRCRT